jgi:hypothetical protein
MTNKTDARFNILILETVQERDLRRKKQSIERKKKLQEIEDKGFCEYCGKMSYKDDIVKWCKAATCYHWDIEKHPEEDPNRKLFLCEICEKEYYDHWNEMWNEYYYTIGH